MAMATRIQQTGLPMENNVVVAGIGCSGNLVHLVEGPQPFGFHGIHGRTLPVAFGVKMARPELNVVIVAGDGDFMSIGGEHIAPAALRNLNVAAIIMDNGVYGLTKGQSSPTTPFGGITPSTPYGKPEKALNPLELYLALGVSFVASVISTRVRDMASIIVQAMNHPGFAVVNIQSPCTTYNDTFEILKGNPKKGIEPSAWDIPKDHDPSDWAAAHQLARKPGWPIGVLYRDENSVPFEQRVQQITSKVKPRSVSELMETFRI